MSTASEIVKAVGGAENITALTHCATRLRFELADASGVDAGQIEMTAVPLDLAARGDRFHARHRSERERATGEQYAEQFQRDHRQLAQRVRAVARAAGRGRPG